MRQDLTNTIIAYTPKSGPYSRMKDYERTVGRVELIPWPDTEGKGRMYSHTVGACFASARKMDDETRKLMAFIQFTQMVIRDGLDPRVVHMALIDLFDYRDGLSSDVPCIAAMRRAKGEPIEDLFRNG